MLVLMTSGWIWFVPCTSGGAAREVRSGAAGMSRTTMLVTDDVGLDLVRAPAQVVGQLGKYRSGAADYVERATSSHRAPARRERSPPWP
jgi:hypothetical protein